MTQDAICALFAHFLLCVLQSFQIFSSCFHIVRLLFVMFTNCKRFVKRGFIHSSTLDNKQLGHTEHANMAFAGRQSIRLARDLLQRLTTQSKHERIFLQLRCSASRQGCSQLKRTTRVNPFNGSHSRSNHRDCMHSKSWFRQCPETVRSPFLLFLLFLDLKISRIRRGLMRKCQVTNRGPRRD